MKKSTTPKLKPIGDRIYIATPRTQAEEKGERTVGGIVIPESASVNTKHAVDPVHVICEVLAVGADVKEIAKGDRIAARKQDIWIIHPEGLAGEHAFIFEKHVMAVVA